MGSAEASTPAYLNCESMNSAIRKLDARMMAMRAYGSVATPERSMTAVPKAPPSAVVVIRRMPLLTVVSTCDYAGPGLCLRVTSNKEKIHFVLLQRNAF